jgi:DNA-binding CsgD family transcriptional regulator
MATTAYDRHVLYGRDVERRAIGELLDRARDAHSGALVVRGEPGIGKTALLLDARDRAADMHVLSARGVESESELPFAAMHQLTRPALDHLDRLSPPQAAALRRALGLEEGGSDERFLVFAACLSLLAELAERRPVLCLIDDAHWLDAASADALRFVARRLDAEGIVMLFGSREGDVRRFDAPDLPSLVLHGLDDEAAATLLARGTGVELHASVRDRLLEQTRGNALALLEVPSELTPAQLAGSEALPDALPMTRQVETVFLERVRRLPEETQQLLLVAAADDSESAALVARAGAVLGAGPRALDPAEEAGLISVHATQLDFRHPLVRSAVYEAATSSARREAHSALADALGLGDEQADRRAWHLAAAAVEPDEEVVQALEDAAERAQDRSGYMAAARALERAAQLSSDDPARGRRLVGAARAASLAGSDETAVALAEKAFPLVDDPLLRAEITRVRGIADIQRGRPADAASPLIAAAREISTIDQRKALELLSYAVQAASQGGDLKTHSEACALAAEIAHPREYDDRAFFSDALAGYGAMAEGDPARGAPLLERAVAWGSTSEDPRELLFAAVCALWLGLDEEVLAILERGGVAARNRGAVATLIELLGFRSSQLAVVQRFDGAELAAAEALRLARELGADNLVAMPLIALAHVAAVRGEDETARARAGEALELATAHGLAVRGASVQRTLAMVDLGRGRWAEALEQFNALVELRPGIREPYWVVMTTPDRIEAALRAGRPDEAQAALPTFEAWATHSGSGWAQPLVESCRALLSEGDEATEHFQEALRQGDEARPFDLARIQLLYGEHLRRERRRVDARVQLRAALGTFERLGAEPWAERARAELRASGETARKRDPSTQAHLTPQERQIARLVAQGLSNKEVAGQLFLSPRTIDAHLRNVFAKLGIRSRTQLARAPLGDEDPSAEREAATV